MGLGFEVHWLDCASVAFILLYWLFGVKKKEKKNEEKEKIKKEKSYAHWYLGLAWFVGSIMA